MATLNDVAREAGLSPTAVSRYLNNRLELPQSTRERIDAAVDKLGYRPNLLAKRLSTGRAEAIGLVTPEIANPFFAELAAAVEAEADRHGYAVYLSSTRGDPAKEARVISYLTDQHVDGLIMTSNRPDDGALAKLLEGQVNVVVIDEDIPGANVPRIFVENEEGAYLATRHLIEHGHVRIAHVSGSSGVFSVGERLAGYRRAMREGGLPVDDSLVMLGNYDAEFGFKAAEWILDMHERPTAIFAGSDYIVVGMLRRFRQTGIKVPEDRSIVGFDDVPLLELIDPPLTTIRQPIAEMGRRAVATLLTLLGGGEAQPLTRLPVELIERKSVSKPDRGAA